MNLGIDFGSTYTTLSRYVDDTDQLQDIVLHEGVPYIPSVAAEKEGKFQFGSEAKAKTGKKGYTTYKIRQTKLIGQGTLTAIKNGTGGLDAKTIARLCEVLECQPGDLMEYVKEPVQ